MIRCITIFFAVCLGTQKTFEKASSFLERSRTPMSDKSPFIFPAEVEQIIPFCDLTRARMEKRGLFPKRIRITPRRIGWRRSEIEAWTADPEGWRRQHQANGSV
jgi:predicted DNA-binding transcriptional regulator AlpA